MKKHTFLFLVFLIPFIGISQLYTLGAGVTDIDGNTYQTIIINGQEWMVENLRTGKYSNGEAIPNIPDNSQWSSLITGAWVHYNNNNQNEVPYGKLYNWYTVVDSRNVCPSGWLVPSDSEWTVLTDYLGGNSLAGGKMKSTGTQYWLNPNGDATNESGFSGLPGGTRNGTSFMFIGGYGSWWSNTSVGTLEAWSRGLNSNDGVVDKYGFTKGGGLSVRCLKNSTSSMNEIKPSSKTLIKIFDILGNETANKPNELQFYLYNDGSIEKKIVIER